MAGYNQVCVGFGAFLIIKGKGKGKGRYSS